MKLDLRKTRASTVVDNVEDDIFFEEEKKGSIVSELVSNINIEPKTIIKFIVKLAFCGLGTVALIYFEKDQINKLNVQKADRQKKLDTLNQKKQSIENKIKTSETSTEASEEFNNKLNIMQGIVNHRLDAVKGLDNIRDSIPKKVWLTEVDFRNKQFKIRGHSITNKEIQEFVVNLEKTDIFAFVRIDETKKDKNIKNQNKVTFTITSELIKHTDS